MKDSPMIKRIKKDEAAQRTSDLIGQLVGWIVVLCVALVAVDLVTQL